MALPFGGAIFGKGGVQIAKANVVYYWICCSLCFGDLSLGQLAMLDLPDISNNFLCFIDRNALGS